MKKKIFTVLIWFGRNTNLEFCLQLIESDRDELAEMFTLGSFSLLHYKDFESESLSANIFYTASMLSAKITCKVVKSYSRAL